MGIVADQLQDLLMFNFDIVSIPKNMTKFIELTVSEEFDAKTELVNIANIGRVFPSPQSDARTIVELNYQSVNDSPVYLEVEMRYETLRQTLLGQM